MKTNERLKAELEATKITLIAAQAAYAAANEDDCETERKALWAARAANGAAFAAINNAMRTPEQAAAAENHVKLQREALEARERVWARDAGRTIETPESRRAVREAADKSDEYGANC